MVPCTLDNRKQQKVNFKIQISDKNLIFHNITFYFLHPTNLIVKKNGPLEIVTEEEERENNIRNKQTLKTINIPYKASNNYHYY